MFERDIRGERVSTLRLLQVILVIAIVLGFIVGYGSGEYAFMWLSILASIIIRIARFIWRD
jgi:hypothetical protein